MSDKSNFKLTPDAAYLTGLACLKEAERSAMARGQWPSTALHKVRTELDRSWHEREMARAYVFHTGAQHHE
jgi:hypothetical protein